MEGGTLNVSFPLSKDDSKRRIFHTQPRFLYKCGIDHFRTGCDAFGNMESYYSFLPKYWCYVNISGIVGQPQQVKRLTSANQECQLSDVTGNSLLPLSCCSQEHFEQKHDLVIEETELKQVVYIFSCNNSTLQIKGKINSIIIGELSANRGGIKIELRWNSSSPMFYRPQTTVRSSAWCLRMSLALWRSSTLRPYSYRWAKHLPTVFFYHHISLFLQLLGLQIIVMIGVLTSW